MNRIKYKVSKGTEQRKSHLRIKDAIYDAFLGFARNPTRTFLAALGTIIGVGTLVSVSGIATTAKQQVTSQFNSILATEITVSDNSVGHIPFSAQERVMHIKGVAHAGISWQLMADVNVARDLSVSGPQQFSTTLPIYASTPDGLTQMQADIITGRLFDKGNERRFDRVALIGSIAARQLGITSVANRPAIFINGTPFTIIGIVTGLFGQPSALSSIIIPASTGLDLIGSPYAGSYLGHKINEKFITEKSNAVLQNSSAQEPTMYVTTAKGAAGVVGKEIAYAIYPQNVNALSVITPPGPDLLSNAIEGTTATLLILLGIVALVTGGVVIANTSLLSVLGRTSEIGLRRALGARRKHIAVLTLLEAGCIGAIGGMIGASLGVLATVGVAATHTWTPVLSYQIIVMAPFVGAIVGILAGIYPSIRATRIEPVSALQH